MQVMQVALTFTGICAFVKTDEGYAAIMPNARKPHEHMPWMHVVHGNSTTSAKTTKARYALTNEELWFDGCEPGPLKPCDPGKHGEPPAAHPGSVHWIIPFEKASRLSAALKPEYLDPSLAGGNDCISVFFRLPAGDLVATHVRDCIWFFLSDNDPKPQLTQSCAQEVSVMIEMKKASKVTIAGRDLLTDQRTDRVIAVPAEGSLQILIGNTMPSQEFPSGPIIQTVDEHFRIYYEMLTNPVGPADQRLPHQPYPCSDKDPFVKWPSLRRASGYNCPPVLMFPVDDLASR